MYFRCSTCHASVWLTSFESTGRAQANCRTCGQEYRFSIKGSEEKLHSLASAKAAEHGIDLPGACSVVLRLMTVEQIDELGRGGSGRIAPGTTVARSDVLGFDPAFADAVAKGSLTPRQALERGEREAFAATLRNRHDLPERLAYAVADNRMPLVEALRARGARAPIKIVAGVPGSALRSGRAGNLLMGTVVACLVLGSAAWVLSTTRDCKIRRQETRQARESGMLALNRSTPESPSDPKADSSEQFGPTSEIVWDEAGQPVRIAAGSPTAVMLAYCAIERACELGRPVELAAAVPAMRGARIGLFTAARERTPSAIWIRKDSSSGRWIAGNGVQPITPVPEIGMRVGGPRVAVDRR